MSATFLPLQNSWTIMKNVCLHSTCDNEFSSFSVINISHFQEMKHIQFLEVSFDAAIFTQN